MVPGVLLLDAALHVATQALTGAGDGQSGALRCQIASAKFLSPVLPGEILTIACSATPAGQTRFDISAGGRPVATGSFALESVP